MGAGGRQRRGERRCSWGSRVDNDVANAVVHFARDGASGGAVVVRARRRGMGYAGREQLLGTQSSRE